MTHPTQKDDVKAIRDALAAVPKDWRNLNSARTHPEDDDLAEVGGIDGDGRFSEVFTVDCGNYFAPEASLPLAQFYAAANPERIARLLARLEQAKRDKADAEQLAADRLDQMNADRKQALVWRDRVAELEAAIRADFDPAWECTSRHPKLSKIGGELVAAIASEAGK